jgi:Domain of unknown function DUF29
MSTLTPTLYATDYYRWLEETVTRLQERDFDAVDWENLIEEVSDLGKSQKNAVKSLMIRLVEHLFKLAYWERERMYNARKWRSEIVTFRSQIRDKLEESPTLRSYLLEIYPKCLEDARESMGELFDLPQEIEISLEQAIDKTWFPETAIA